MPPEMLRDRRDRIAERLAHTLGLPPDDVAEALEDLARTSRDGAAVRAAARAAPAHRP